MRSIVERITINKLDNDLAISDIKFIIKTCKHFGYIWDPNDWLRVLMVRKFESFAFDDVRSVMAAFSHKNTKELSYYMHGSLFVRLLSCEMVFMAHHRMSQHFIYYIYSVCCLILKKSPIHWSMNWIKKHINALRLSERHFNKSMEIFQLFDYSQNRDQSFAFAQIYENEMSAMLTILLCLMREGVWVPEDVMRAIWCL